MPTHVREGEFPLKKHFMPLTTAKVIRLIIIAGIIIFSNALFNSFVWDDLGFIVNNPEIHSFDLTKIFGYSYFNADSFYRPIPALYFSLLYAIFKANPFFYHLAQIALHILNASLLYLVFQHFFRKACISLFLSLFFLAHPIQVESVSFIGAAGSPLFFLFGTLALLLSFQDTISRKRLLLISILLMLSFLTKEAGLLFLGIILSYRLLFKRINIKSFFLAGGLAILLYALLRFGLGGVYYEKYVAVPIAQLSFQERLINIPAVIFYYIKTFFFPVQLAHSQQWTIEHVSTDNFYLPLLIITLVFILIFSIGLYLIKYRKDSKVYFFFLIWFLAGLLLITQLIPLTMTVADRWFYFPIVGILGIIGSAVNNNFKNIKINPSVPISFCIVILIILSFRTMVRNTNWKDNLTLYSHDIKIYTYAGTENDLGLEYARLSQYDKAITHYHNAIKTVQCEDLFFNLGLAYENIGDKQNAEKYLYKAIQAKPCKLADKKHNLDTYKHLGIILMESHSFNEARKYLINGLIEYPESSHLWGMLAVSEYKLHNQKEAVAAAQRAKELLPNEANNYIYTQIVNKKLIEI